MNRAVRPSPDHLGSTTVTTDVNGAVIAELHYKPWGEVRSGSAPTKYTFTGQYSNVSDFGLMFYNARWLDPALGRFASADSLVPPGLQGYDRYAYANNNPVNYTDPTGHFGKHRDDKSDYWNKRNQHKVKDLEAKWEREKAEKGLAELVNATRKEMALDPVLALAWGGGGPGKPLFAPSASWPAQRGCDEECMVDVMHGVHAIGAGLLAFGVFGTAAVAVAAVEFPVGLLPAALFLVPAAAGLNVIMVGVQTIEYAGTDQEPDPLPLVHIFFPDFMPY